MTHIFNESWDFRDDMRFGEFIRKKRRLMGLNQTDFAELLGVNQGTESQWELGVTSPPLSKARKIIEYLGGELLIVNKERDVI